MRRAPAPRSALVVLCRALVLGGALALALPGRVSAQELRPSGSLTGHFLISDGDLGGLAMLDVWAAFDWLRVGGFVGAGAIPSPRDAYNRVMMPAGLSLAGEWALGDLLALSVRVRAGLWGGSTQSEKITGGGFAGGGAYLGFRLGGGAQILVGTDAWAVISSQSWRPSTGPDDHPSATVWVIAPGVGFSWTPEAQ
jgi:hypothetical protein